MKEEGLLGGHSDRDGTRPIRLEENRPDGLHKHWCPRQDSNLLLSGFPDSV